MKQGIKILGKLPSTSQRKKIWSIEQGYICSVLGTCFRRSELRKMARKKQFGLNPGDSDFLLHSTLVSQVGGRTSRSRVLNKTLDNKYRISINRYAKAKDDEAIKELWEEDIRRGNVPGAYWAIMTHPSVSNKMIGDIYGQVHMMGHDTHGDYQRDNTTLTKLKEKVALLEEVMGNERRLHLKEKKALKQELSEFSKIEQLYIALKAESTRQNAMVDRDNSGNTGLFSFKQELDELRENNANLIGRIDELTTKLEDREDMLELAGKVVDNLEKTQTRIYSEKEEFHREIVSLEAALLANMATNCDCVTCGDQGTNRCPGLDLCGKTVLYVGGRQNLVPMYRRHVERHGGNFLHHDGGIEVARSKLPEMLTGADVVVCPVDCVSHDACTCVKKICKRYKKHYVMMRSSGLSSLLKGLNEFSQL